MQRSHVPSVLGCGSSLPVRRHNVADKRNRVGVVMVSAVFLGVLRK
ncbi:MAG: hypothetical protein P8X90_36600 [Desulfobacterales bacterium]